MKAWIGAAFAVAMALPAWADVAPMGDDGLYKEPWMRDTFKDLREDLAEANAEGRRLVLFVEQRGCIYCHKMHEEVFSLPDVAEYIEENFFVVQINLHGDTEITDFDGESLSEKAATRKWRVLFTPNIVFLPEEVPEGETTVAKAAVAIMPGAFGKLTFLNMFRWVREKGYEGEEHFQKYHARIINELRAAGRLESE